MNAHRIAMRRIRAYAIETAMIMGLVALPAYAQDTIFAVVTSVSKDKRQATAHVSVGGSVSEASLVPTDDVFDNPIWRSVEICHSLKAEGHKASDGYRITAVKALDAGMLPMALQGVAGECLLKKALEFAPLVD
jgi:hypothetical protein